MTEPGSKEIPEIVLSEGTHIRDKTGLEGTFDRIDVKDGEEWVRVRFPDYVGTFPKKALGKTYEIVSPSDQPAVIQNTDPEVNYRSPYEDMPIHRDSVLDRLDEIPEEKRDFHWKYRSEYLEELREYVKIGQGYNVDSLELTNLLPEQRDRLAQILHEAHERDYVFRSEGRHPYAQGTWDKITDVTSGPFEIGMQSADRASNHRNGVYLDASPTIFLNFPDVDELEYYGPRDVKWDHMVYLYIINPKVFTDDPNNLAELDHNEIDLLAGSVGPEYIPYALQIDRKNMKLVEIFENPKALKN